MKQPKIYSLPPELHQLLDKVLVAAASAQRKLAAELERRGVAVKRSPEEEAVLHQMEDRSNHYE
jgi:hypothetical protein